MNTPVDSFNKDGYVLIKNVLDLDMVKLISQYALFDERRNFSLEQGPNPQIHNSHSSYADPLMESLLLYMHSTMEENTGLKLYPTYSYYRVYRPGAELLIHKDRASCEISTTVTLLFDYKEKNGEYEWPIFMKDSECSMNPGDIVIYRGCDLDHWREEFTAPEGSYHVQAFLHYVDANGPHADHKWDRRESVGVKNKQLTSSQTLPKKYITLTD